MMESLAFNIIARIDDLLYVDDATRRCSAAESMSLFERGGLSGLPIQKQISLGPFSIQQPPYASPFATPTSCSSSPLVGSPGRAHPSLGNNSLKVLQEAKLEKLSSTNVERV